MTTTELSPQDIALLKRFTPLIQEYIDEVKMKTTVDEYVKELAIVPIEFDGVLMGFWGLRFYLSGPRKVIVIKGVYIRRQYRGRYLNKAADKLFLTAQKKGIKEVELWSYPEIQRWLARRYGLKTNIHICYTTIDTFKKHD